jgi:hypothetical protein
VTDSTAGIERFDSRRHNVAAFTCGNDMLDRWFKHSAGQSERRDAARTFVATAESCDVLGYYTLVAGQIEHDEATPTVHRGLASVPGPSRDPRPPRGRSP